MPRENAERVGEILKDTMETIYPDLGIRLDVDVHIGDNWVRSRVDITKSTYDASAAELAVFAGFGSRKEEPINNRRICSTI